MNFNSNVSLERTSWIINSCYWSKTLLLRGKLTGKLRRHTPSETESTHGHCPIIDQSIRCPTYKLMTRYYQPIEIVRTFKNSCKIANLLLKLVTGMHIVLSCLYECIKNLLSIFSKIILVLVHLPVKDFKS